MEQTQFEKPDFSVDAKLLSFISHHVRGQYNGLLGFSELLNQNYFRLSDDERLEYILQVNFLAKRAFVNVENMVLWLKLLSNNLKVSMASFKVADVIDHAINMCTEEAESLDVNIAREFEEKLNIKTDRLLCSAIITNLLSNAIKTSSSGNTIRITCPQEKKGIFCISIEDESPEIKNAYVAEYFSTAPEKRKEPYQITAGLGLWIANALARELGGYILLEKKKGNGKAFKLFVKD